MDTLYYTHFSWLFWEFWRKGTAHWISGPTPFTSICSGFVFRVEKDSPALLEEPILKAIAKKHNKSPGQVALRYQVQRGVVVLAKSFNEKRIKENFQVQAVHCLSRVRNGCCTGGHLSCLAACTYVHSFPCISPLCNGDSLEEWERQHWPQNPRFYGL